MACACVRAFRGVSAWSAASAARLCWLLIALRDFRDNRPAPATLRGSLDSWDDVSRLSSGTSAAVTGAQGLIAGDARAPAAAATEGVPGRDAGWLKDDTGRHDGSCSGSNCGQRRAAATRFANRYGLPEVCVLRRAVDTAPVLHPKPPRRWGHRSGCPASCLPWPRLAAAPAARRPCCISPLPCKQCRKQALRFSDDSSRTPTSC